VGDVHIVREAADAQDAFPPEQAEDLLMALLRDEGSYWRTHAWLLWDVDLNKLNNF
jgi:hypothetical protein